jgi:tetratricopeptide (TPR) repeat protein
MTAFRSIIMAAALLGAAAFVSGSAFAVDSRDPVPAQPSSQAAPPAAKKEGIFKRLKKKFTRQKKTPEKKEPEKKSEQQFIRGYHHAHDLIYKHKNYAAGIVALRALHRDDNADVANLVGFSSRKLGRTDDAKVWYEKALAADPRHTRTWQYYGMWHLEQGNRLKAEEHLEKIAAICGTGCDDYKSLKLALAGGGSY